MFPFLFILFTALQIRQCGQRDNIDFTSDVWENFAREKMERSHTASEISEIIGLDKWDTRFVELARFVSGWSRDPDAKVGAVITDEDGAIALGFNGFPKGILDDERLKDSEEKLNIILHAEENAILQAGDRAKGATLYVWGKPVCVKCARIIIQQRVSRVVLTNPKEEDKTSKWCKLGIDAVNLLEEAGVERTYYRIRNSEIMKQNNRKTPG